MTYGYFHISKQLYQRSFHLARYMVIKYNDQLGNIIQFSNFFSIVSLAHTIARSKRHLLLGRFCIDSRKNAPTALTAHGILYTV